MSEHLPECLHDWPDMPVCICNVLRDCRKRVLLDAIAAIDEQNQLLWSANTLVRLGMGIARAAVIKLIQKKP